MYALSIMYVGQADGLETQLPRDQEKKLQELQ